MVELEKMLAFAHELAWNAGKITLHYFQTSLEIEAKADDSPITLADRETETFIRKSIGGEYPAHAILGEEFGESNPNATYRWIIDPIDGTKSYIRGVPLYSVMIGLEREGVPVLGVVNFPALREIVYGAVGLGCWWNGRACHVSTVGSISEGLVLASKAVGYDKFGKQGGFDRLLATAKTFRTWGDSYGYVLVATGRAEAMLDPTVKVWDIAALQPILNEAGGYLGNWSGIPTIYDGEALGSNNLVMKEVLELIKG